MVISNTILKNNKVEGLTLPHFKIYCKAIVIKTVCYQQKKIDEQISGTEQRAQIQTSINTINWFLTEQQRHCSRAKMSLEEIVLEQLDIHMQQMSLDTDFTPFTSIISKQIINLHVNHKTLELVEDNTGENLIDLGCGHTFLYIIPEACSMKDIIDKLDFSNIKNFSVKDNIKRIR